MNKSLFSAVLVLAAVAAPTFADDLAPPTWRGGAGTTFQHWDFSSGSAGGAPDAGPFNNTNGTPNFTAPPAFNWLSTFAGRNDVWTVNGTNSLVFDIPNFNVTTHQKDLVLQITYLAPIPGPPIATSVASSSGLLTQVGPSIQTFLAGGWIHEVSTWRINTCPAFERVTLFPPQPGITAFVDQVVIDTRCYPIPTPGALALLGVSGLLNRRRR